MEKKSTNLRLTDYEMRKIAKYENECYVESLKSDDELLDLIYPPKFLNAKEAAEYIRIPLGTIYHRINEIPHEKVGKRLLFTDRGLVRWVKRMTGSKEH